MALLYRLMGQTIPLAAAIGGQRIERQTISLALQNENAVFILQG